MLSLILPVFLFLLALGAENSFFYSPLEQRLSNGGTAHKFTVHLLGVAIKRL